MACSRGVGHVAKVSSYEPLYRSVQHFRACGPLLSIGSSNASNSASMRALPNSTAGRTLPVPAAGLSSQQHQLASLYLGAGLQSIQVHAAGQRSPIVVAAVPVQGVGTCCPSTLHQRDHLLASQVVKE